MHQSNCDFLVLHGFSMGAMYIHQNNKELIQVYTETRFLWKKQLYKKLSLSNNPFPTVQFVETFSWSLIQDVHATYLGSSLVLDPGYGPDLDLSCPTSSEAEPRTSVKLRFNL